MDIKQVNSAIITGTWTNDELNSMIDAIKFARSRLTNQIKVGLATGDTVEFTSSKTGRRVQGTVTKIAQKYVTVRTQEGLWRVPANMLKAVETA